MRIIEVGKVRTAKDGRQFFVAGFRPQLGQRQVNRTFWQQFKKNEKGENITDQKYWERLSPEEAHAALESREIFDAVKETRSVESYFIGDREVNTYSTVIFPDETVENVFSNSGHGIVDPVSGELLVPARQKATLAPPTPAPDESLNGGEAAGAEEAKKPEEALAD